MHDLRPPGGTSGGLRAGGFPVRRAGSRKAIRPIRLAASRRPRSGSREARWSGHARIQLKATSRIIITVNPPIAPSVARSEFPLVWDSGTTSSMTTKIIAPAAKARA